MTSPTIHLDQLYYIVCLLLCIPLSYNYRLLPGIRHVIHLYSIITIMLLCSLVFSRLSILYSLIPSVLVWGIGYCVHRNLEIKRVYGTGICVFVWSMLFVYLSYFHINRMYLYWMQATIDETTVQMIITMKLTTFITDYTTHTSENPENPKDYPELLHFLGFMYFIPSYFVGPTLTLDEYTSYVDHLERVNPNDASSEDTKCQLHLLSTKTTVLLLCAMLGLMMFSPFYMTTSAFAAYKFLDKLKYLFISMLLVRCKYYFAWSLAEMSYIISSCSQFVSHKGRNVHILDVELPHNTHQILNSWNICTNMWLKTTVYEKVKPAYGSTTAIIATNVVSAFWHGFYPGYYITFLFGGFSTMLGRMWRRNISHGIFGATQNELVTKLYNYAKIPMMLSLVNFFGLPFQIYSLYYIVDAYNALRWYGLFVCIIGFVVAYSAQFVTRNARKEQISNKCKDE